MLNKKILLLLIFILITIIVWYFSSPAKMIQIKNVNDYNEKEIFDMEASGFFHICSKISLKELIC